MESKEYYSIEIRKEVRDKAKKLRTGLVVE